MFEIAFPLNVEFDEELTAHGFEFTHIKRPNSCPDGNPHCFGHGEQPATLVRNLNLSNLLTLTGVIEAFAVDGVIEEQLPAELQWGPRLTGDPQEDARRIIEMLFGK